MNMDDNNYTIEIIDDNNYDIVIDKDGFIGATSWGSIVGDINNQSDLKTELDKKEDKSNKSNILSSSSTDEQYPTSKVVYDTINELKGTVDDNINNLTETVNNEINNLTETVNEDINNLTETVNNEINNLTETVNEDINNLTETVNNEINNLTETVNEDINNLTEFKEYSNNTFETKVSHSLDMNKKANNFIADSPLQYANDIIELKMDSKYLLINPDNELAVNVDGINSELKDKLDTDISNVTDTGKQAIIDIIPNATVQDVGLVKPDNTTITIDEDGTIHSVGGGGGSKTNDYGIKGDYSTHYGILDCPNGLIDIVSGKTIKINSGIILQCAGQESKTTIASSFNQELTSTGDIVLFYAGGSFIECGDVFYQETEPEDGTSNYIAWYKPSVNTWSFKSNDTGNVFRTAIATPVANIRLTSTDITRIDYIGYRILDDEIFALKTDLPTKTSELENDSGYLTSLPNNVVTTDKAQTISSPKAFLGTVTFNYLQSYSNGGLIAFTDNDNDTIIDSYGIECTFGDDYYKLYRNDTNKDCLLTSSRKIILNPKLGLYAKNDVGIESLVLDEDNFEELKGDTIDGQWVAKKQVLSTATAIGTYEIDLSDYLPDNNYNYEVFLNNSLMQKSVTDTTHIDIVAGGVSVEFARANSASVYATNSAVFPIDSTRKITLSISTRKADSNSLTAYYYRRIGTNS